MKRAEIRTAMESHMKALGFSRSNWEWLDESAQLMLIVNGAIKRVKLRAGMSQKALTYEMGRVAGWAEIIGIEPKGKANGHTEALALQA